MNHTSPSESMAGNRPAPSRATKRIPSVQPCAAGGLTLWFGWTLAWLLVAGCQPAPEPAWSDPGERYHVEVMIQTNRITVGDPVRVRIIATHPVDTVADLPDLGDVETLTVRDRRVGRRELDAERQQTVHDYTLTAFRIGPHPLGTGTVHFVQTNNARETVSQPFPSYSLTVESVRDPGTADVPAPLRGLWDWPARVPRWVRVFGGIALAAVLLGMALAWWSARPRRPPPTPPPPPAHEVAWDALRRLRAQRYIEQGAVEPFYVELSAIIRRYLEDRFGLRAPELTTEEFIREAASAKVLHDEVQALVTGFLTQSDLVKFARFKPDASAMQAAFGAAERLIRDTEPGADAARRATA